MVVDDNPVCGDVLGILLRGAGYAVQEAVDGRQALDRLRAGPAPGLIVLDLAMPVVDGRAFRAAQVRDPALADIPIVVLTGGYGPGDAASLNAAGYLVKPADLTQPNPTAVRAVAGDEATVKRSPRSASRYRCHRGCR